MDALTKRIAKPQLLLAALATVVAALAFTLLAPTGAGANGGVSPTGDGKPSKGKGKRGDKNATPRKYHRLWNRVNRNNRRWARRVADCESGRDPNATALDGQYRGAFMFTQHAWKTSPKTPGGDPINYSYKTQAVVAVHLKKRDGTRPWPHCG